MVSMVLQTAHRRACADALGLVAGCLAGLAGLLAGCQSDQVAPVAGLTVRVTVAVPIEREVVDCEDFTGRTDAVASVELRSRVSGYLDKILFEEGSEVKKGALLFQIDPRPFQAAYDRAVAEVALKQANLKFRETELRRNKPLVEKNAISQSEFDQIVAAHEEAIAAVTSAQANTEEVKLNLEFTRITSPIDGRISKSSITVGNLVRADQTLLTTVVSVDPMYVNFDVDERTLLEVQQNVREGKTKVSDKEEVPVWMGLANEKSFPHSGIANFSDNRVDPNTGTIRARAVFPNAKPATGSRVMVPGLFARVRLPISNLRKALLVAERAVGNDQGQKFLLIVNGKNEVEYRRIRPGKLEEGLRVIEEGLKAGEAVIVTGVQRVRPGMTVETRSVDMQNFSGRAPSEVEPSEAAKPSETAKPSPVAAETPEKK